MRVSGWRQQRLPAVAAVLAVGGTGARAWRRGLVTQSSLWCRRRTKQKCGQASQGAAAEEENWRWAERWVRAGDGEEIVFCQWPQG
jgi:hypothetical protein